MSGFAERFGAAAAKIGPALSAAAIGMGPGQRQRIADQIEAEELQAYARCLGLTPARADAVLAEVDALVATLPYEVPLSERIGTGRRRLIEEALGPIDMTPLRSMGVATEQAIEGFESLSQMLTVGASDQAAHDTRPDDCWRCDAAPSDGPLGLCSPCRTDLAG